MYNRSSHGFINMDIFSRLNDSNESIEKQCSAISKLASELYSIDFFLPTLLIH